MGQKNVGTVPLTLLLSLRIISSRFFCGEDKFELMKSVSGADNVDHNRVAEEENQE